VLQLAITKADDIRDRADAKGMKVIDLLDGSSVKDYLVYCHFSDDRQLADVYGEARTVIEAQGARVIDNPDDAAQALENAAAVTA
jgi:ribosomal silencing factor RsfS